MAEKCIACGNTVRPRQHGVSCDSCERWQHRTCDTGISLAEYKRACNGGDLNFVCRDCMVPLHQSSTLEESEAMPDESEDNSIRLSLPFVQPEIYLERSLADPPVPTDHTEDLPLSFSFIAGGSQKGKDLLVDTHGYSYVLKDKSNSRTRWRCSVRNKSMVCGVIVTEKNGQYKTSDASHIRPPDLTKKLTSTALSIAKPAGVKDPFTSASNLIQQAIRESGDDCVEPVQFDYLTRRVNRARESSRPVEPKDLEFEFNHDACPVGFIQADLRVDDRRHILFATESQLTKLAESKTWYMDGTFKCTRKPFEMLFSIHAFVRRGSTTKQVPLLYVIMSGRRAKDYESILTEIKRIITPTSLHQIVVDFESALWKACRSVFPGIRLKGCAFHWGQAVFWHVQILETIPIYHGLDGVETPIEKTAESQSKKKRLLEEYEVTHQKRRDLCLNHHLTTFLSSA